MSKSKKTPPHSAETKQLPEQDSHMPQMLKIRQGLKTTTINMLRGLMEKVHNAQKQMGNVIREMKTLRKNQREMLQIKNAGTEMKNAFLRWALQQIQYNQRKIRRKEKIQIYQAVIEK